MLKHCSNVSSTDGVRRHHSHSHPFHYDSSESSSYTYHVKIYARSLGLEYKTLRISKEDTSSTIIRTLLSKTKNGHRDPRLFYLSLDFPDLEKRSLPLEHDSHPGELLSLHPKNQNVRLSLNMRNGIFIRIHNSILLEGCADTVKCLLLHSSASTSDVISLLVHHYEFLGQEFLNSASSSFVLIEEEVCEEEGPDFVFRQILDSRDQPAVIQSKWSNPSAHRFVLRHSKDFYSDLFPSSSSSHHHLTRGANWNENNESPVLKNAFSFHSLLEDNPETSMDLETETLNQHQRRSSLSTLSHASSDDHNLFYI